MSLREEVRRRKSLRNLRALIATADATILLAVGTAGLLTLTATMISRASVGGRAALALVAVLATAGTVTSYGWYFGHVVPRAYRPTGPEPESETHRAVRPDGRWRYDNAGRARSREHIIMDTRRSDGNGRIHRRVHLDRGPNRTVARRLEGQGH